MKSLLLRMVLIALILLPLCSGVALARQPDCVWSAHGCAFRAYLHNDGGATIFMECDDFIYMYSGAGTSCPAGTNT